MGKEGYKGKKHKTLDKWEKMQKLEMANPCFVCGHYHKFEDGEVCIICG
jgi:hypothetical protein